MGNKVAIYLRKSRGVLEDLEKHKEQLIELCNKKKYEYEIYKEIASSDTMDRKELNLLLDNIAKYDKVVVTAIDRLSRNEYHQALITQILKENNVEIITPNRSYNFSNETDIITSDFEKLLARQEFRIIKGRLKAGKLHSFKQGNFITTPPFPYVYNRETKTLDIPEEDYKKYRYIVELALQGLSPTLISEKVGMKALNIRRMLANPVHRGYVKYANKLEKGRHKAIMTQEEFNIIENYKKGRTCGTRRTKHIHSLSSLIKCGGCGYTRTIKYRENRKTAEAIAKCQYCGDEGFITTNVKQQLRTEIKKKTKGHDVYEDVESKKIALTLELDNIADKIIKLKKQQNKAKEMILADIFTISEGKEKIEKINKEIIEQEKIKELVKSDINSLENINIQKINLEMIDTILSENITKEETNTLYKLIINKIIVKDKEIVEIDWK